MILKLATGPTVEPVTTEEAKTHLRVTTSADDTYIGTLIKVARQQVEDILFRALVNQTWDLVMDGFPGSAVIKVPLSPLSSVTSIKYITKAGATVTYASANYVVDTYSEPGRISLVDSAAWPGDILQPLAGVLIRFVAGYGAAAINVPEWAKQAILLTLGDWYENREDTLVAQGYNAVQLPNGAMSLLWPRRMVRF